MIHATDSGKGSQMKIHAEKTLLYGRIVTLSLLALILAAVLGLLLHLIFIVMTG